MFFIIAQRDRFLNAQFCFVFIHSCHIKNGHDYSLPFGITTYYDTYTQLRSSSSYKSVHRTLLTHTEASRHATKPQLPVFSFQSHPYASVLFGSKGYEKNKDLMTIPAVRSFYIGIFFSFFCNVPLTFTECFLIDSYCSLFRKLHFFPYGLLRLLHIPLRMRLLRMPFFYPPFYLFFPDRISRFAFLLRFFLFLFCNSCASSQKTSFFSI